MKIYLHRLMLLLIACTMSIAAIADDFTLKGKVVDEEEHALEFVTVMCPSQGKVTMTNLKGEFNLDMHSADSVEIKNSRMGHVPRRRRRRNRKGTKTEKRVQKR